MLNNIHETIDFISANTRIRPTTGIILGTGLGGLIDEIEISKKIPYKDIPHFPTSTVEGHSGNLILGKLNNHRVVVMQGRFHYYEGYSMQEVTFPVRILKGLGIQQLFLSNAAGGINPDFSIGDLMTITDHINLFPDNPLRGPNDDNLGPRFPDMSEPYSQKLIDQAHEIAGSLGFKLHKGVYVGNQGPSFETPAEYTFYRLIGGSAVGMSTVPEVIVARHMGLPVFAVSVITNIAVPGNFQKNNHLDVQEAAEQAGKNLAQLCKEMLT
ncbi:MAG: purine-nucleoside phosphorylase [Bacteroidetes bacterium]|jgi:purine-nucleoside phosphorylase|nr:purine-nucleoside phosphorylase [Bacteroidota bacterium]MBT3751248.1 purine-nucleoside phosphorylase [Bacteroidota bacterium]MBT4401989.1 purine-nucleoside phosphorylase [Bacteroidota bacterium]MBT7092843.1 purine-nucleoside phosphorylase [Bacteroidota bacterium]MBT7466339.1 purine-nucleoside phosphorylase [Bacteroidota bacterium]